MLNWKHLYLLEAVLQKLEICKIVKPPENENNTVYTYPVPVMF